MRIKHPIIIGIQWWKWLGLILVFISFMVGLITPLAPGIQGISKYSVFTGDTLIEEIQTVNAHFFTHPQGIQGALSYENEYLIKALQVKALSENKIRLTFYLPKDKMPKKGDVNLLDIALASNYDGFLVLRQGIELKASNLKASELKANSKLSLNDPSSQGTSFATTYLKSKKEISSNSDKLIVKNLNPKWFSFPYREILYESIRNLFFHVAMWPVMLMLFSLSVIYSIRYLRSGNIEDDFIAVESVQVGLLFASIGIVTGSLWAKYTWGDWWPNDPKLNGTAIAILLYFAYIILRNSLTEEQQKAKISAVYNIFSFPMMFVVIMILPRLTDSLHPGNGGNPGFNTYDLDSHLRIALYPAFLGWILIGFWLMEMKVRIRKIEYIIE